MANKDKTKGKWEEPEEQDVTVSTEPMDDARKYTDRETHEAMEAMRRYTDEDDDDFGEISIKSILGGDFLMSRFMIKQIMFVIFCVILMLLYTANRYSSQQDAIFIDSLQVHLQEVKYNVLTQSSELMNLMRQSNIEKALRSTPDSVLHNSITPPFLIRREDKDTPKEEAVKEVLVSPQTGEPQPRQEREADTIANEDVGIEQTDGQ